VEVSQAAESVGMARNERSHCRKAESPSGIYLRGTGGDDLGVCHGAVELVLECDGAVGSPVFVVPERPAGLGDEHSAPSA